MTPAKAAIFRSDLIEQRIKPRQEVRKEEASRPTISNLYEAYSAHRTFSPKGEAFNKYLMSHLQIFFDRTPDQISTIDMDRLRNRLLSEGKSPQTAKHVMAMMKRLINHGAKHNLCEKPKNLYFNMPKVDNQKTEMLTMEQIHHLLQALDQDQDQNMADFMRLALYTGVRRSALLALTWADIDFERNFITLKGAHASQARLNRFP
jgi:Site-specific recombinase XerD